MLKLRLTLKDRRKKDVQMVPFYDMELLSAFKEWSWLNFNSDKRFDLIGNRHLPSHPSLSQFPPYYGLNGQSFNFEDIHPDLVWWGITVFCWWRIPIPSGETPWTFVDFGRWYILNTGQSAIRLVWRSDSGTPVHMYTLQKTNTEAKLRIYFDEYLFEYNASTPIGREHYKVTGHFSGVTKLIFSSFFCRNFVMMDYDQPLPLLEEYWAKGIDWQPIPPRPW